MRRHNVPIPLTSFVGREQETAHVQHLLAATRLLTLSGAAGVGKTRLALEVARGLLDDYPDGVYLVELAALSQPRLVGRAVGRVLAARDVSPSNPSAPEPVDERGVASLARRIGDKRLLLVLDNCEHLIGACAALAAALLRACPGLRVLATSREPLRVDGEVVWRVPALSLPDAAGDRSPEALLRFDAPRLFVARATAALPGFALEADNAARVAEICRRLDGIPLAIELTATRVRALGIDQIADRLDDRFRLLTAGSRSAVAHHQTLRAAIDWSHELLSVPERVLFRRLAVFADGWTLEAAERVCDWGALEASSVLELLFQLVDRSVVTAERQHDEARYRLLETLRQYGLEKLAAAGPDEERTARDRHRDWYLDLAERAAPELSGPAEGAWLERLEVEHANVRAALAWALERRQAEPALRFGAALWKFWVMRGHQADGLRYLQAALALDDADDRLAAPALTAAGILAWTRGELDTAHALHTRALTVWHALADRTGIARAEHNLGNVAADLGDYPAARAHYAEALAMRRALGEQRQLPYTLSNLARVARCQGAYAEVLELEGESLAIARASGDRWAAAHALKNLGCTYLFLGDVGQARTHCLQSLELFRELGAAWGAPFCLEVLAAAEGALGNPLRAGRLLGAADAERQRRGLRLPPAERVEYERMEALARGGASPTIFAPARTEGQAMSLDEALGYALADPRATAATQSGEVLSQREREVVDLIARGLSNREIAELLVIAPRTAEAHVSHVLTKLGLRSRAQVAIWAMEHGLLGPAPHT